MQVLFQLEPGKDQALMRKKKINIHLVGKKCIGFCVLKWRKCEDRTRNMCRLLVKGMAFFSRTSVLSGRSRFAVAPGEWFPVT